LLSQARSAEGALQPRTRRQQQHWGESTALPVARAWMDAVVIQAPFTAPPESGSDEQDG
jgi:hypothetical protein